jgi:hypothetical protein
MSGISISYYTDVIQFPSFTRLPYISTHLASPIIPSLPSYVARIHTVFVYHHQSSNVRHHIYPVFHAANRLHTTIMTAETAESGDKCTLKIKRRWNTLAVNWGEYNTNHGQLRLLTTKIYTYLRLIFLGRSSMVYRVILSTPKEFRNWNTKIYLYSFYFVQFVIIISVGDIY